MKFYLLKFITLFTFFSLAANSDLILTRYNTVSFKENKGQVCDQNLNNRPDILFYGSYAQMDYYIKNNGISYQLYTYEYTNHQTINNLPQFPLQKKKRSSSYRIDINWLNCQESEIIKSIDLPSFDNYYLTNCPNGVTNVKTYSSVMFKGLYPGINLHYYSSDGKLKYDYIINKGVDYKKIKYEILGADSIYINKKSELVIVTPLGNIIEEAPIAFQNNKKIDMDWSLTDNVVSFSIKNYEPNQQLVIDPLVRVWGTFCGGNGDDIGMSCSTDQNGNIYVAGYTNTTNSGIATSGAHQTIYSGATSFCGNSDAFLIKFNNNGIRLWGTYYGDGGNDEGHSCSIDVIGNIYITGYAQASINNINAIATPGSYSSSNNGAIDAFLVKFNTNGFRLWGTYYGGGGNDLANGSCIDSSGNIYICGSTDGDLNSSLLVTSNAAQSNFGGGSDAFYAKFDGNGNRLYATFFGGTSLEVANACCIDKSNNFIMTGATQSINGVATLNSHQNNLFGIQDAFISKHNSNGILNWSSYYGGNFTEESFGCAVDSLDNIYICGYTDSPNNIATSGSDQSSQIFSSMDAFLVKFASSGTRQWGTYYGGYVGEIARGCSVNKKTNDIYMIGQTNSSAFIGHIPTIGCFQDTLGGIDDAFLAKYNSNGSRIYSTYYGGNNEDWGFSVHYATSNNSIYICGFSDSTSPNSISTPGSHQTLPSSVAYDLFLVKFFDSPTTNSETQVYIDNNSFKLFPNPNSGDFNIIINDSLINPILFIYNSMGQLIYDSNLSSNISTISLKNLNDGIYFLNVKDANLQFFTSKLIIKKSH